MEGTTDLEDILHPHGEMPSLEEMIHPPEEVCFADGTKGYRITFRQEGEFSFGDKPEFFIKVGTDGTKKIYVEGEDSDECFGGVFNILNGYMERLGRDAPHSARKLLPEGVTPEHLSSINPKQALRVLLLNGMWLIHLPDQYKETQLFRVLAACIYGGVLREFQSSSVDAWEEALNEYPTLLKDCPDWIKKTFPREFYLELVARNGLVLKFVPREMRSKEIRDAAIANDPRASKFK